MDSQKLDVAARLLGTDAPRRRIIGGLAGGLVATLLGGLTPSRPALAACKQVGQKCGTPYDCCRGGRCQGGWCACKSGWEECGGRCHRLTTDKEHCGACGNACAGNETCCGGRCANLDRDRDHCGVCGNACPSDRTCIAGRCSALEEADGQAPGDSPGDVDSELDIPPVAG